MRILLNDSTALIRLCLSRDIHIVLPQGLSGVPISTSEERSLDGGLPSVEVMLKIGAKPRLKPKFSFRESCD